MSQINLHTTPQFEDDLAIFMKARGLRTKSEAIRLAVHEAAVQAIPERDIAALRGFVHRLPGGWQSDKTGAELEAEIDAEMDAKLERLARRLDRR